MIVDSAATVDRVDAVGDGGVGGEVFVLDRGNGRGDVGLVVGDGIGGGSSRG